MNQKFSFRAIQQGQTQQSHVVNAGAGQNGQALVVRAAAGTRYQLADLLTLTSPKKLQLKRVGQDLLVALPGNDVTSPDIVIKDYFNFKDLSLSGLAASGEPMVYDTSSSFNIGQSATGITPESLAANKTTAATLATASGGWFDGGMGLAALGGGGLLLAAAAGGGSDSTTNAGLAKITTYKGDATKSVPTVTDFATAGVTGVDASNITGILTLFSRTQLPLDTAASLQTLVDSFKKIVAEANGTSADATTEDPSATDYVNLMGSNTPNSVNTKPQALALLNDRVKALNTTDVDSYSEVKALADIVETIATLAQTTASTTGTAATTGNITAAQLTSLGVDVAATSLTAMSDAIRASADDLSALNTTAKLKALVEAYNTILKEANGSTADADTSTNPSAADYATIGADIGTAKTDTAALARLNVMVGNVDSKAAINTVDTVAEITKLAATLDKIQTVAASTATGGLAPEHVFTADELKNLGLTGFGGTVPQNDALATEVSKAIRDKAVTDVVAGTNTGTTLESGVKVAVEQTQLKRLQALVSLEIIKNYKVVTNATADNFTTTAPTLADWQAVGIFKPHATDTTKFAEIETADVAYLNTAADKLEASGTVLNNLAAVQTMADAYFKIIKEANGSSVVDADTASNPAAADYAAIGITGKTITTSAADHANALKFLNDIVGARSLSDVSTVKQIQTFADLVDKIYNLAARTSGTVTAADQVTVAEFQSLLGATLTQAFSTSTANNNALALKISQAIADADPATFLIGQGVRLDDSGNKITYDQTQIERLQALVSLEVIKNYEVNTGDTTKTTSAPSAADWRAAGVFKAHSTDSTKFANIDSSDLTYLNSAADALAATAVDHTSKLQAVADAYFKIIKEANGSLADADTLINPVKGDFVSIGAIDSTLSDNNANLLASLMGEKGLAQVNTVTLIKDLLPTIQSVMTLAGKADTANVIDADTTNDLDAADVTALSVSKLTSDLSLQGVNDKNHKDILAAIQNKAVADVDTFAELQSLVSLTRIQKYATDKTTENIGSNGELTSFDWSSITGLNSEVSGNTAVYNKAVDIKDATGVDDLSELQAIVTNYNAYVTDWATRVEPVNIGTTTDLFHSYLVGGIPNGTKSGTDADNAIRIGKLIDLAEITTTATTYVSSSPSGLGTIQLQRTDLASLGLNTNNIGAADNTRANRNYQMDNIWATIQNETDYKKIDSLEEIQGIINYWTVI